MVSTSIPLTPCFTMSQYGRPASLLPRIVVYHLLRMRTSQRELIAFEGSHPTYFGESLARAAPASAQIRAPSPKDNRLLTLRFRIAKRPSTSTEDQTRRVLWS